MHPKRIARRRIPNGLPIGLLMSLLIGLLNLPLQSAAQTEASEQLWEFDVFLNDRPVGFHRYRLNTEGDVVELSAEADFKVKVLFVTAFRYRHNVEESWRDGCLQSLQAKTNVNGRKLAVSGQTEADQFLVRDDDETRELGNCVKSFAYWNPKFLESTELLNPQTGDLVAVRSEFLGEESITVAGEQITAKRYRLKSDPDQSQQRSDKEDDLHIELWYGEDGQWLALESSMGKGRNLQYKLRNLPS